MAPELTLRPARPDDAARLLEWRNDPGVRAASLSQEPIPAASHERWLSDKLRDPDSRIFIVELGGRPVGQVRLDRSEPGEVEVHVGLASEARGQGVGTHALGLAAREAVDAFGPVTITARVKPENERSLRAFAAAGFEERDRSGQTVVLVLPVSADP